MEGVKEFFAFVDERQRIWHRRNVLKLPFPWTEDKILKYYEFCNVYREWDKGTIYLNEALKGATLQETYFGVIAYRFLNNVDAFMEIGGVTGGIPYPQDDLERMRHLLHHYKEKHGSVFGSAYRVICNIPRGTSRVDAYIDLLKKLQNTAELEVLIAECRESSSYAELHSNLDALPHVGPFLAYELITDLRHLDPVLNAKFTEDDWAYIGPGAQVGLRYIFTQEYEYNEQYMDSAMYLQWKQDEMLPADYPGERLSLRNIEHSLCEFGKYKNIKNGRGKSRPLFTPPTYVVAPTQPISA